MRRGVTDSDYPEINATKEEKESEMVEDELDGHWLWDAVLKKDKEEEKEQKRQNP